MKRYMIISILLMTLSFAMCGCFARNANTDETENGVTTSLRENTTKEPVFVTCEACGGNGLCSLCAGTGGPECENCKGTGTETCMHCDTRGRANCRTCNGMGYFICTECNGKGWINGEACSVCKGNRSVNCEKCEGTGRTDRT